MQRKGNALVGGFDKAFSIGNEIHESIFVSSVIEISDDVVSFSLKIAMESPPHVHRFSSSIQLLKSIRGHPSSGTDPTESIKNSERFKNILIENIQKMP